MGLTWSAESDCGATCCCFLFSLAAEGGDTRLFSAALKKEEVNVVAAQREGLGVNQSCFL